MTVGELINLITFTVWRFLPAWLRVNSKWQVMGWPDWPKAVASQF